LEVDLVFEVFGVGLGLDVGQLVGLLAAVLVPLLLVDQPLVNILVQFHYTNKADQSDYPRHTTSSSSDSGTSARSCQGYGVRGIGLVGLSEESIHCWVDIRDEGKSGDEIEPEEERVEVVRLAEGGQNYFYKEEDHRSGGQHCEGVVGALRENEQLDVVSQKSENSDNCHQYLD